MTGGSMKDWLINRINAARIESKEKPAEADPEDAAGEAAPDAGGEGAAEPNNEPEADIEPEEEKARREAEEKAKQAVQEDIEAQRMAYKYHIDPDVLRAWHRRKGELAGK